MHRSITIILAGLFAAAICYSGVHHFGTAANRALLRQKSPELSWLKKEFKLSDAEFERISALHAAYLPQCAEMCHRINAAGADLTNLLSQVRGVTPEVEAKLLEIARLRAECQKNMLRHFFKVSEMMPPEQGRRYLEWVERNTLGSGSAMGEHRAHE